MNDQSSHEQTVQVWPRTQLPAASQSQASPSFMRTLSIFIGIMAGLVSLALAVRLLGWGTVTVLAVIAFAWAVAKQLAKKS